jgi:hypothetical protein
MLLSLGLRLASRASASHLPLIFTCALPLSVCVHDAALFLCRAPAVACGQGRLCPPPDLRRKRPTYARDRTGRTLGQDRAELRRHFQCIFWWVLRPKTCDRLIKTFVWGGWIIYAQLGFFPSSLWLQFGELSKGLSSPAHKSEFTEMVWIHLNFLGLWNVLFLAVTLPSTENLKRMIFCDALLLLFFFIWKWLS